MLLPNPLRHYPVYKTQILYADKAVGCTEGQGEVGEIYVPDREVEVLGVAVTGCDLGKNPCGVTLWVRGEWTEFYGDWIACLSKEEEVDEPVEEEEEDVEEDDEGEEEEGVGEDAEEEEAVRWEEDKQADEEASDYADDYDHDTFME
jgi:hypothetical protein